jgi:hypothetical protein
MPEALLRVAFPNPVVSAIDLVKFAVHDLMMPPIAPVIATLPSTPLIAAIGLSPSYVILVAKILYVVSMTIESTLIVGTPREVQIDSIVE